MRILPFMFVDYTNNDIDKVLAIIHAHFISKEACKIYVVIGKYIPNGKNLKSILNKLVLSEPFERLRYIDNLKKDDIKSSDYVVAYGVRLKLKITKK